MTEAQCNAVRQILEASPRGEFHHGDCIGADAEAHDIARALGYRIVMHPPINQSQRAFKSGDEERELLPYLDRNRRIVTETDALIAAPGENIERLRSGTWSTVRYARRVGRSIYVVFPDGTNRPERASSSGKAGAS